MGTITNTISSIQTKFTDIDFGFNMNPATNDVAKKNDDEAIKQSLRNLILTKKYERPFQSELFSQLYDLLFEHFTASTKSAIQIVVSNVIKNFEPRVKLTSIIINDDQTHNALDITLYYVIAGTTILQQYTITVSRIR